MNTVDLELLKRITEYGGGTGFNAEHPAAKRFWRVLEGFTQAQLAGYL